MNRLMRALWVATTLAVAGCASGPDLTPSQVSIEGGTEATALYAWRNTALVVGPKGTTSTIRAFNAQGSLLWEREQGCVKGVVVAEGLVCQGVRELVLLSGEDGQVASRFTTLTAIVDFRYEGGRVSLQVAGGARHSVDVSNGHLLAPGVSGGGTPTAHGRLLVEDHSGEIRATQYGSGQLAWVGYSRLWPAHQFFVEGLLFQGQGPGGRVFAALVDAETRTVLSEGALTGMGEVTRRQSNREGVLVVGARGVLGLRRGGSSFHRVDVTTGTWALAQAGVFQLVKRGGDALDLVWRPRAARRGVGTSLKPARAFLSRPGLVFHGAWVGAGRGEEEKLKHLSVRVRRWTPDLVYAWRTSGPWTARRMSPEASGDRGFEPAFDGAQPFSPMPLWFSPVVIAELMGKGRSQVGKVHLVHKGQSYHRLAVEERAGGERRFVSLRVMVIERVDTGDRYWVAPNGSSPMVLRAERGGGLFFLATVVLPPKD